MDVEGDKNRRYLKFLLTSGLPMTRGDAHGAGVTEG